VTEGENAGGPLPRVDPFGDAAILVTLGDRADPVLARRAGKTAQAIDPPEPGCPVSGRPARLATVLVPFDPLEIDPGTSGRVRSCRTSRRAGGWRDRASGPVAIRSGALRRRGWGPEAAAAHDLRPADVVELHAAAVHTVLFLGFAPGFAYLGGLPEGLVTPRRATPRERVPAGSVAIAGEHSGVYPRSMPGGWNLIGRTDRELFDPGREPPSLLEPGALVRFVPAR
jgi:allophanate hydrolase subunit 1